MLFEPKSNHFLKRSKIFLGITTGILAVAGVAAAKRITAIPRLYCTQLSSSTVHYCESTPHAWQYTATSGGNGVVTVVAAIGGGTTSTPVFTKGTVDHKCAGIPIPNCINQLVQVGN